MALSDRSAKRIIIASFLLAILLLLPENVVYINTILQQALPWSMRFLFLVLPICMYWGLYVDEIEKKIDQAKMRQIERDKSTLKEEVLFQARYRNHPAEPGTEWEVRNLGLHRWDRAIFLIERIHGGEKTVEKHVLNDIKPNQRIILASKLSYIPTARWRSMVMTDASYRVDLAERWTDLSWHWKR